MSSTTKSLHSLDGSTSRGVFDPSPVFFILSFLLFGIVRHLKITLAKNNSLLPRKVDFSFFQGEEPEDDFKKSA